MSKHADGAQESNAAPPTDEPNWEGIARQQLELEAEQRAREAKQAAAQLAAAFGDGDADPEDLRQFRRSMDALLYTIEDDIAGLIEGIDPYDAPGHYLRDDGEAAAYLDITESQANEARNGPVLELGEGARKELAAGHTVALETDAGIEVTLTPEQPDPVTHELTLREGDLRQLLNGDTLRHGLGDGQTLALDTADIATENTGP